MKLKHFLLTALTLFAGVSGVYAAKHYVGFTGTVPSPNYTNSQLQDALTAADDGNDTVFVAEGLFVAENAEFTVPPGVTLIGGYAKTDAATLTRRYPGQFVPFSNSDFSVTHDFTILDGNSYKRTLPAQKHRVIKVESGGVVDGCLIRNGHVRNSNGGGVLLNGGKLYNSIVRGNVAMSKPDTIESLGGGVFIQNGGELINCLVAYNMANDGYGVAAGEGGGKMINNTITANTYAPVFSKIPGGTFKMYAGKNDLSYRPEGNIPEWNQNITLSPFYLSRTLTTEGQYAVFCAALDITKSGTPVSGYLSMNILGALQEPTLNQETVEARYKIGTAGQIALTTKTIRNAAGLNYDGVFYPHLDTGSVEYPMGCATFYGVLAYSVWLGGGLPTEAQWEYAARLNSNGTVSNNLYSGAYGTTSDTPLDTWKILDTIAWVDATKSIDTVDHNLDASDRWESRPHEVARKRPNAMGIYDMTGGMGELCADAWSGSVTTMPVYSSLTNPIFNSSRTACTVRGGTFITTNTPDLSLTNRINFSALAIPEFGSVGFRPIVAF